MTWVTQSEAARRETEAGRPINQSSISRFLKNNPDVPVQMTPDGKRVQHVDYEALVKARTGSLSVQDSLLDRERSSAAAPASSTGGERSDSTSERIRLARARSAEMDLAEREGELISRAGVVAAVENIGAELVQALERRRRPLANRLAGMVDVRAIELELKRSDADLRNSLADRLEKLAGGALASPETTNGDDGAEAAQA